MRTLRGHDLTVSVGVVETTMVKMDVSLAVTVPRIVVGIILVVVTVPIARTLEQYFLPSLLFSSLVNEASQRGDF